MNSFYKVFEDEKFLKSFDCLQQAEQFASHQSDILQETNKTYYVDKYPEHDSTEVDSFEPHTIYTYYLGQKV